MAKRMQIENIEHELTAVKDELASLGFLLTSLSADDYGDQLRGIGVALDRHSRTLQWVTEVVFEAIHKQGDE